MDFVNPKSSQTYLDDILVRLAYHSSAIEGNTLTFSEAVSIIIERNLPSNRRSIREFYEIENHKQAFSCVMDLLANAKVLELGQVQDMHALLVDRLQHDCGLFKTQQNAIIGAEFKTATPTETPFLMQHWVDNTTFRLEQAGDERTKLEVLAETHIQFERIHPFSDGNGRTGRLLLMYLAMKYLNAPVIITKDIRVDYMELLANQDVKALADILAQSLVDERERMTQFN